MKRTALAVSLMASAAIAETSDWQTSVTKHLAAFEDALRNERVIAFVAPLEHPEMVAASAAYLGLSPADYRARINAGYARSTEQTDFVSFTWGNRTLGNNDAGSWAVASYQTVLAVAGQPKPIVSCARVVIFGEPATPFVTVIGSDVSEELFVKAVPDMGPVVRQNPARC